MIIFRALAAKWRGDVASHFGLSKREARARATDPREQGFDEGITQCASDLEALLASAAVDWLIFREEHETVRPAPTGGELYTYRYLAIHPGRGVALAVPCTYSSRDLAGRTPDERAALRASLDANGRASIGDVIAQYDRVPPFDRRPPGAPAPPLWAKQVE